MAVTFGLSSKHKPTAIYKNYIYNKYRVNQSGYITWRCQQYQKHHCKAQLVTKEGQLTRNSVPVHTHGITHLAKEASAMKNNLSNKTASKLLIIQDTWKNPTKMKQE